MTKPTFDMDAALQALRERKDLTDKDGILTPLISTTGQKEYRVKSRVAPLGQTKHSDDVYYSVHYRGCDAKLQVSNLPIALAL